MDNINAGKDWCWTQTYQSIVAKKGEVGQNWGFCKSKAEIAAMVADYEISIKIPNVDNSSGGDGPY